MQRLCDRAIVLLSAISSFPAFYYFFFFFVFVTCADEDWNEGGREGMWEEKLDVFRSWGNQVMEHKFNEEVSTFVSWMAHPYFKSVSVFVFGLLVYGSIYHPAENANANGLKGLGVAVVVYLLGKRKRKRKKKKEERTLHHLFSCSVYMAASRHVIGAASSCVLAHCEGSDFLVLFRVGVAHLPKRGRCEAVFGTVGSHIGSRVGRAKLRCPVRDLHSKRPNFEVRRGKKELLLLIFHCRFRNVYDALIDEHGNFDTFILCHVLGWFCKMIMLRDVRLRLFCYLLFSHSRVKADNCRLHTL